MIQNPNISINSLVFQSSPSPSSSTATAGSPENHHLRCPRCDSSNTKFCYYNNYNLTQPRHFCKTCRRYWTKGGALRNVPIGGGCRKNKGKQITAGKLKAAISGEIGTQFINGFEHSNPILWASPIQTSHLLSLLRSTQTPNPNFAPNSDAYSNVFNPLWRDVGIIKRSDGQGQLYQRLRSSPSNYYDHDYQVVPVVNTSSSTCVSTVMESAPAVGNGESGLLDPTLAWSDLPSPNGAFR